MDSDLKCAECGKALNISNEILRISDEVYGHILRQKLSGSVFCLECTKSYELAGVKAQQNQKKIETALTRSERWLRICPPMYSYNNRQRLIDDGKINGLVDWEFGSQGLLFHGPTDTGKTRSIMLILHDQVMAGKDVRIFFGSQFSRVCHEDFMNGTGPKLIQEIIDTDIVFFDDLGKFKFTERVEAELFSIIEERIIYLRPTMITTNFDGNALADQMSDNRSAPFIRRLRHFSKIVAF